MIPQATGTLTICDHTAPLETWRRALERARASGVKVYRTSTGEYYATSTSRPGQRHHVNGSCDCEGARHGRICKHLVAVRGAQYRAGELHQCAACGRAAPTERMVEEDAWLGGVGYVERWYCNTDITTHLAR